MLSSALLVTLKKSSDPEVEADSYSKTSEVIENWYRIKTILQKEKTVLTERTAKTTNVPLRCTSYLSLSQSRLNDLVDERASELVFIVEDFGPEVHVATADQVSGCKNNRKTRCQTSSPCVSPCSDNVKRCDAGHLL